MQPSREELQYRTFLILLFLSQTFLALFVRLRRSAFLYEMAPASDGVDVITVGLGDRGGCGCPR